MQFECEQIVKIAKAAGKLIMEIYGGEDIRPLKKVDGSIVTYADECANELIVRELEKLAPRYPILSEEGKSTPYSIRKEWQSFWLVDPLDGTKEFLKKNGEFTVNIALVKNNKPVLGVVCAPAINECYFGAEYFGAFKIDKNNSLRKINVASKKVTDSLKIVASKSHFDIELMNFIAKLENSSLVNKGSSLKICLVAEGVADFYPRLSPTMEWDTAAAHAIVNAAGGRVQNLNGDELSYNSPSLINPSFFVRAASNTFLENFVFNYDFSK